MSIDERHNETLDEQIDVAVRVGMEPDCSWIVRALGTLRLVQCAAPAYLRRRGDLAAGRLVGVLPDYASERRKVLLCYPRRAPMHRRLRPDE